MVQRRLQGIVAEIYGRRLIAMPKKMMSRALMSGQGWTGGNDNG